MFSLEMTAYQKRQNFAILKNPSNVLSIIIYYYYIPNMFFVIYRAWQSAKTLTEQERLRHGNIYIS